MLKRSLPLLLSGTLVLVACGESATSSDSFDADRACRIGQRLVDETADADRDGVINQIERLDDLDGATEAGYDVDDLDTIAEGLDASAVDDLIAELEVVGCDIDEPDTLGSDESDPPVDTVPPLETTPPATAAPEAPPATDAPPTTDAPPATEPRPTTDAPPATDAPEATTPVPDTPSTDGNVGTPIDVGSTGPGPAIGVNRPTEEVIADFEMAGIFYSPNTNVVEVSIDRSDFSFGGDLEWSNWDTITMSAATTTELESIRDSYKEAIEGLGVAYDITESTTSSDGTRSVGLEARPTEFDSTVPRWTLDISQTDEDEGVVLIKVQRNDTRPGAIPPIPEPARPLLDETAQLGADLGWTVTSYRLSEALNSFSGGTFTFGTVRWDISEDDTHEAAAAALKEALGGPFDNEDQSDDSITWFLPTDERPLFSVRYSEFGGTTASFTT